MCCLFGLVDPNHSLSIKQKNRLLSALAKAAEIRGTDATGIAYEAEGSLHIYKRPLPAHRMTFRLPNSVGPVVMGHTRMTTQGKASKNYNNHPFYGSTTGHPFALAHNGVICNDLELRHRWNIPLSKIETDSYIAVQLLEQAGDVSFETLRFAAEQLDGSFTISVMTEDDDLYLIKGNNPLCIYQFVQSGLFLYASTEDILKKAIRKFPVHLGHFSKVPAVSGCILRIDHTGKLTRETFDDNKLYDIDLGSHFYWPYYESFCVPNYDEIYIENLKATAAAYSISEEEIDSMLSDGYTTDDIEDMIYCTGGKDYERIACQTW